MGIGGILCSDWQVAVTHILPSSSPHMAHAEPFQMASGPEAKPQLLSELPPPTHDTPRAAIRHTGACPQNAARILCPGTHTGTPTHKPCSTRRAPTKPGASHTPTVCRWTTSSTARYTTSSALTGREMGANSMQFPGGNLCTSMVHYLFIKRLLDLLI